MTQTLYTTVTSNMINHHADEDNTIMAEKDMDVTNNTINLQECDGNRIMADNEANVARCSEDYTAEIGKKLPTI